MEYSLAEVLQSFELPKFWVSRIFPAPGNPEPSLLQSLFLQAIIASAVCRGEKFRRRRREGRRRDRDRRSRGERPEEGGGQADQGTTGSDLDPDPCSVKRIQKLIYNLVLPLSRGSGGRGGGGRRTGRPGREPQPAERCFRFWATINGNLFFCHVSGQTSDSECDYPISTAYVWTKVCHWSDILRNSSRFCPHIFHISPGV